MSVSIQTRYELPEIKHSFDLTEEQRPREAPNGRRPITDFVVAGPFPG